MTPSTRGQATIELMVILPLLLLILAVSISIFSQQILSLDASRAQHAAERSAQLVAESLAHMSKSPPGSRASFFIPPGITAQTIYVREGIVEVVSFNGYASVRLPSTGWTAPLLHDGNFFTISIDENRHLSVVEGRS